jgi:hypothetical protein
LLDEPLFHCLTNRLIGTEPPGLQSLLQWPKHGERSGSVTGVILNTPAKTAQGVPCCVGSMWACVIVEHKHTPGQFSRPFVFDGPSTIGMLPYVSMFQLNNPYICPEGRGKSPKNHQSGLSVFRQRIEPRIYRILLTNFID